MKIFLFVSALLFVGFSFGQTAVTISPAPAEKFDIFLTPFGLDNPVNMGNLDISGKGVINEKTDFGDISESKRTDYVINIVELLSFCDNSNALFAGNDKIEALEIGPYFLMKNNELAGFITIVSDTALTKWVNDPGYEKAIVGSWFELIYVSANFDYTGNCTQTTNLESGDDIETAFELNLNLEQGLNYLEYKIESVYDGDSEELASNAKKVVVTAHQSLPANAKMIAYYY